jgi:hypothetical protein
LLAWTGEEEGSCSVVIFCCEEAGILGDSSVASSSLLIEISFDCSDSSQNKSLIKPNNQTPNKKDGSVVIYKVGTDNIITEATNSLSNILSLWQVVEGCCLPWLRRRLCL